MKAAFRTKYGPPQVISIKEVEAPVPKENQVLVKVHAATVNRTDCGILWGKPRIVRLFTGWSRPRLLITGSDFAGEIEATGKNVQSFKTGDRVMGFQGITGCCSHSQYLVFPESKIIAISDKLSYEEAVACIEGAFYASVGIRYIQPKAGQKALVNGATGAIGSSYVQFLKACGVYVTAVCSKEHEELVRLLGASKIIDYRTEDFTKDNEQYDFVINTVPVSSFFKCKRLLKKGGMYLPSDGMENLFLAPLTKWFSRKRVLFLVPKDIKAGLNFIKGLIEKGSFRPVIDRKYPLEKIAEAYSYVASGQKIGNVVITMDV
jgi:NADPH:quinone reductase-like Zn-dependent oxidoreductase